MKYILFQRQNFSLSIQIQQYLLLFILILFTSCSAPDQPKTKDSIIDIELVPTPVKVLYKRGSFKLDKTTRLLLNLSDSKSKLLGEYFIKELKNKTYIKLKITDRYSTNKIKSGIELITEKITNPKPEEFKIEITTDKVKIYANDKQGLLYGINTVISLFTQSTHKVWLAPQLTIRDYPNNKFRGLNIKIDSLPYSSAILTKLLKKNRINYLLTDSDLVKPTPYLQINTVHNIKSNDFNTQSLITIKSFYQSQSSSDSMLFNIIDASQLNPDSLAIIGEAMWSKPSKLNYNKLMNRLSKELKE